MFLVRKPLPHLVLVAVMGVGLASSCWADVAVFQLNGVYSNPDPWLSSITDTFTLTGQITWTYAAGSFNAGSGTIDSLTLPYGWAFPQSNSTSSLDLGGIQASQTGNTHDYTYDLAINFDQQPTGPLSTSTLSGSYDLAPVSNGYFGNGEAIGTVTGTLSPQGAGPVPEPSTLSTFLTGLGLAAALRVRRAPGA